MNRSTNFLVISAVAAALALLISSGAPGQERPGSLSVGNPNDGKLVRGVRLPDRGPGFYSNPHSTNRDAKYGTEELIAAIMKAGADVERHAPGATLIVNDLGFREGGDIPHHQSHEAGRDVDLLFYMNNTAGEVFRSRAVRFDDEGRGVFTAGTPDNPADDTRVTFDVRRNWLLMKSFVENPDALLQRVFVSEGIRSLLLEHARERGDPPWVIERAGEVMCQPRVPHDDHFHVRLFCTAQDYREGCRDAWPIYPWRRTELAGFGFTDVNTAVRRRTKGHRHRRARRPRRPSPGRVWCP